MPLSSRTALEIVKRKRNKVINLYINQRFEGNVTILDLKGRVRIGGATISLHRSIRNLVEEGKMQILLNLADVTAIDSSGLGELVSSQITLGNKGGEIKLFHLTEALREIMANTRLVSVFDIYDTESEALASFGSFVLKVKKAEPFFV
jgi:anti-sigma B factor antagonist